MRPGRAELGRVVGARARRKQRARRERRSVWFGLGMFGVVGWSVAVPTLLGIAVGAWLDAGSGESSISWTLTGLALGIAAGCAIAWYWVRQQIGSDDREAEADIGVDVEGSDDDPAEDRRRGPK